MSRAGLASGLPRAFWFLWTGTFINRVGGLIVPFLTLYLTGQRHLTTGQAGTVVALFGAGSVGAGPLGGWLADRLGRRPTLVSALTCGAAAALSLGLARSFHEVCAAAFALGLLGEMYRPAVAAMVSDLIPPEDRPRAFALIHWVVNLGFSAAAVIAGWLAARDYWLLFVGDAVTTFAFALLLGFGIPETRPPRERSAAGHAGVRAAGASPYGDPVFLAFMILGFCTASVFHQGYVALPLDMRAHGIGPERYGSLMALNGVLIVLLQPSLARWMARTARTPILAGSALLVGLGFGANALVGSTVGYAAAIAIWTLGEIALVAVSPATVADLAPTDRRGVYQGAYQMAWGAATLAGPKLGTWVMELAGARTLWMGCAVLGVLTALGHVALAGPRQRRQQAVSGSGP